MIFLIGADGKIGLNIAAELNRLNIKFKRVTRKGCERALSFDGLLAIIKDFEDAILINAATLQLDLLKNLLRKVTPKAKLIHISSVSVYGNSSPPNIVNPVNAYGEQKLLEEKEVQRHSNFIILRLANIYGGIPETSGVLTMHKRSRLKFIETDPHGDELVRDYVSIEKFLALIVKSINIKTSCISNVSSGIGLTLSEFCTNQRIDISHLPKVICGDDTILKSVVTPTYLNYL